MKKKTLLLSLSAVFLWSCSDNSPDDLIDATPVNEVTYQAHVKPIIDNNCISCHAEPPISGAPISLTTYDQVKTAVESHGLINRISKEETDGELMPLGGPKLPQNLINIIIQWQTDGFKN